MPSSPDQGSPRQLGDPDQVQRDPWVITAEPLIWLAGADHEIRPDTSYFFDCRLRRDQPHAVLQLTLAGAGFYEGRRGRQLLPPGHAFFDQIPGPFSYGYARESPGVYEQVFVSLRGPPALRWMKRITGRFGHVLHLGASGDVAAVMRTIVQQHQSGRLTDRYLASARCYELLMAVLSTLNRSRLDTAPRVNRAIELIERRGHQSDCNVQSIADALDCSREYLSRQFRAAIGVSPAEYLAQHRVRLAARAMRQSADKLDVIAHRCGFGSANYLCRVFRQRVGVTPAEFRRMPWMSEP